MPAECVENCKTQRITQLDGGEAGKAQQFSNLIVVPQFLTGPASSVADSDISSMSLPYVIDMWMEAGTGKGPSRRRCRIEQIETQSRNPFPSSQTLRQKCRCSISLHGSSAIVVIKHKILHNERGEVKGARAGEMQNRSHTYSKMKASLLPDPSWRTG